MLNVDPALFLKFQKLIYDQTGLHFDERKQYFFTRRLEHRLEVAGSSNPQDYYQMLRYGGNGAVAELQALVESLTTNETYFFREYPQLQSFADVILPEVLERKRRQSDYVIRLWSAGCSTGEEPYTLAIILREVIEDFDRWKIYLTATDINRAVLRTAEGAVYGERALKDVPTLYRQKYFQLERTSAYAAEQLYRLQPVISRMVKFQPANLMDLAVARGLGGQDFLFCRNVLIYFDEASTRQVVSGFYDALRPGGYIFLGHSESVGRITSAFQMVRRGDSLVYMK
jgi:chemotaxis protein methyltransferase CheR